MTGPEGPNSQQPDSRPEPVNPRLGGYTGSGEDPRDPQLLGDILPGLLEEIEAREGDDVRRAMAELQDLIHQKAAGEDVDPEQLAAAQALLTTLRKEKGIIPPSDQ